MFEPSKLFEVVGEPLPIGRLKEVRADPFSLEAVIPWLETKNPAETYCYTDGGMCLIAQYLTHLGVRYHHVSAMGLYRDHDFVGHQTSEDLWRVASGAGEREFDTPDADVWNFGAALRRARSLLQATERSGS